MSSEVKSVVPGTTVSMSTELNPVQQALSVSIPTPSPSAAGSLQGRVDIQHRDAMDELVQDFDEQELAEIERSERFKPLTPEELRDIIAWVRQNPHLSQVVQAPKPISSVSAEKTEDGFVIVESTDTDSQAEPAFKPARTWSLWNWLPKFKK